MKGQRVERQASQSAYRKKRLGTKSTQASRSEVRWVYLLNLALITTQSITSVVESREHFDEVVLCLLAYNWGSNIVVGFF